MCTTNNAKRYWTRTIALAIMSMAMLVILNLPTDTYANGSSGLPIANDNLDNRLIKTTYMEKWGTGYMRVLSKNGKVYIEYYNGNFELTNTKTISMELPVWGGFYKGSDAYYLVEGKNNKDCVDGTEVMRIIKYDTSWNRIGAGTIIAEEGWEYEIRYPFDVSCVNMAEVGNNLYVITGREGYVDPQYGQGHQGMMLIRMDKASFATEIVYGDFWHSFAQYIAAGRGSDIYLYEQSEGSRCTMLSRFDGSSTGTDYFDAFPSGSRFSVLDYGGDRTSAWSIACLATVDDLAVSSNNVIGAGTSIDQSQYDDYDWSTTPYNIYLTVTPISRFSEESTEVIWLTGNENNSTSYKGVSLTKINDDRFLVTWEEEEYSENASDKSDMLSSHTLHYVFIDGAGNRLSDEYTQKAAFSDCHPVICDDKAVFCASSSTNVNFYSINTTTGKFSKKVYRLLGKNVTWKLENGVLTVSGTGSISGNNDWDVLSLDIKKIIVKGTITSISENAFTGLSNLKEVVIESGVKELGKQAFAFNSSLEKITIPASVVKIGEDLLWTGYYWVGSGAHAVDAMICAPGGSCAAKYAQSNYIYYKNSKPKAANPMKVKVKTVTLKNKVLKKKNQNVKRAKAIVVSKAKGKVTYKKVSVGSKKINKRYGKKIVINSKTGNITVKKGLKKGTYKVKVKVTAAGNTDYKKVTKTVTFKIKVR